MAQKNPKVSILCITYNHEKYIRRSLDSFLSQKTDFDFEILIHDDASTDKTPKILKEYQQKYPDQIQVIYREKNLYSQGIRNMMTRFLFPKARGKYIAICEGDDYWTDDDKLQLQADFLDKHSDYALCFHRVKVTFETGDKKSQLFPAVDEDFKFTVEELIRDNFIQTNSVMYRRQDYKDLPKDVMPGDWFLHLYHAQFGKIGFIDRVMSVYRRHPGGIWWNAHKDKQKFWELQGLNHLNFYAQVNKLYGQDPELYKSIQFGVFRIFNALIAYGGDKKSTLQEALKQYPEFAIQFIVNQNISLEAKDKHIVSVDKHIEEVVSELHKTKHKLDVIQSSRTWQYRNKIVRLIGKDD